MHLCLCSGKCYLKASPFYFPASCTLLVQSFKTSNMSELENDLKTADELFDNNETQKAYDLLMKHKENAEAGWRLTRACRVLSLKSTDSEEKKALAYEAHEHAKLGLSLDENNFACHKVSVSLSINIP